MVPRGTSLAVLSVCILYLSACSGGGGAGPPPPDGLSYATPPAFVVGQAISPLSPSVTGTVSAYAVTPALPAGLGLSSSTGVISGTPTAVTSTANYMVKASNSAGSTTTAISLTVSDMPPAISYRYTQFALTAMQAFSLIPTNSGGAVIAWSITPGLSNGLMFNTADGSISGTPTAAAAPVNYVVTARNSGGSSSVNLQLAVQSVLFDLGESVGIDLIRLGNSRVLTLDGVSRWVLWDAGTRAILASGYTSCLHPSISKYDPPCNPPRVEMAGPIFVIEERGGLEIRSLSDGNLIATLTDPNFMWWRLAPDGSYICTSGGALTVWSPTGTVLTSRKLNYDGAIAFAAPGAVRVALGPAGASVIETISVPSGSSSTSPAFQGQFNSWFQDGGQFFTNVGNTVWVYAADGNTQKDVRALPTINGLTGQGSWFWIPDSQLGTTTILVYAVGASASPAATFSVGNLTGYPVASGMTIGALETHIGAPPIAVITGVVHVIDLSGPTPVMADHTTPAYNNSAYAAISSSQWLVGNVNGTLLDGASLGATLRYFGFGMATSIAGSAERVAVATASGKILSFDAATGALEGTIDLPNPQFPQLALSADGSVLVAGNPDNGATTVQVYSMPSGSLIYSWPPGYLYRFSLSDSGTVLGQVSVSCVGSVCTQTRQVTATTGGPVIWSDTTDGNSPVAPPIRLSPDGTLIAVSSIQAPIATNIYHNGTLVTGVPGLAVGWLDNGQLLVENYVGNQTNYVSSAIYDASGHRLGTPSPHEFTDPFQILGPDSIYDPSHNSIFSVTTGAPTFSTMNTSPGVGAVAGSRVVFASENLVLSQPF
jgi:hypothetical protein